MKFARSSLTVLALAALTATALPTQASAAAPCSFSGALCLYDGQNFTGSVFTAMALNPVTGTCVDLAAHGWGAGRVKSAINRNSKTATLYASTNCTNTGQFQYIFPNQLVSPVGLSANSVYVY